MNINVRATLTGYKTIGKAHSAGKHSTPYQLLIVTMSASIVDYISEYLKPSPDRTYFVLWGLMVANGAFWGTNLFFFIIDRLDRFKKYKVFYGKFL